MDVVQKTATVVFGPTVWVGKTGHILEETDSEVVIRIADRDDGKDSKNSYEVRMPKACVKMDLEPSATA